MEEKSHLVEEEVVESPPKTEEKVDVPVQEPTEQEGVEIALARLEKDHADTFEEFKKIIKDCSKNQLTRLLLALHQIQTKPIIVQGKNEEMLLKISNTVRGMMQHILIMRRYMQQQAQAKTEETKPIDPFAADTCKGGCDGCKGDCE